MRSLLAVLLLGTAFVSAQDAKIDELGKSPVEAKFVSGGRIRMDLCSSGIEIVGTDDAAVRVSYHPERDNVRVRLQISGDHVDLRLTGCPHNNFQARIEIPKSSALYVRMMAGQLDVRDVTLWPSPFPREDCSVPSIKKGQEGIASTLTSERDNWSFARKSRRSILAGRR